MKTLVVAVVGLTTLASGLAAQQRLHGTAFADGAIVRWGTKLGGSDAGSFGGPTFGLQAGVSLDKFTLSAQYIEGRLHPRTGSPDTVARDLVEARVLLGAQPVPWLALGVGPGVRAFVTRTETVRWVLWQVRARAQGALPSTPLETYVELWYALSAKVNLPEPVDHVQGGEAGVLLRPPGSAVWFRLGYRVDGARLGGGGRSESLEAVSFALGIGGR
jgi:hypothetical protein